MLEFIGSRREVHSCGDITEYHHLNGILIWAIADDQVKFWEKEAEQMEIAAINNNIGQVFNTLRKAHAGLQFKTAVVIDANGNLITTETVYLECGKEHFSFHLHHPPVLTDT